MDTASAFRTAMAAHRAGDAEALLSPDITFRSPVVHRPYHGRETVMPILHAVTRVLEDFAYGPTYTTDDGGAVLAFSATVAGRALDGVDLLAFDADGLVSELAVYMRPLSALVALQERMAAELSAEQP